MNERCIVCGVNYVDPYMSGRVTTEDVKPMFCLECSHRLYRESGKFILDPVTFSEWAENSFSQETKEGKVALHWLNSMNIELLGVRGGSVFKSIDSAALVGYILRALMAGEKSPVLSWTHDRMVLEDRTIVVENEPGTKECSILVSFDGPGNRRVEFHRIGTFSPSSEYVDLLVRGTGPELALSPEPNVGIFFNDFGLGGSLKSTSVNSMKEVVPSKWWKLKGPDIYETEMSAAARRVLMKDSRYRRAVIYSDRLIFQIRSLSYYHHDMLDSYRLTMNLEEELLQIIRRADRMITFHARLDSIDTTDRFIQDYKLTLEESWKSLVDRIMKLDEHYNHMIELNTQVKNYVALQEGSALQADALELAQDISSNEMATQRIDAINASIEDTRKMIESSLRIIEGDVIELNSIAFPELHS